MNNAPVLRRRASRSVVIAFAAATLVAASVYAQGPPPSGSAGGFEFKIIAGTENYQVFRGAQPVGMVMSGKAMEFGNPQAKAADVQAAYDKFRSGGSPSVADPAAKGTDEPAAGAGGARIEQTSQGMTVALSTGVTVTFQGENDVTVANLHGVNFKVHHKGNSTGGFFRGVRNSAAGKNGGTSLAGGGAEFTDAAGRVLYDTADGTSYRGTLTAAKAVAEEIGLAYQAARKAGRVVNSKVIDDLKGAEDHGIPLVTKGVLAD